MDTNPNTPVTIDTRVDQYVKLRDLIKQEDDAHKEAMKPKRELLDKLNSVMLNHLNTMGIESARTTAGTVYRTPKHSASVADMAAFWTFVVTQGAWDLVDKRANVTAVHDYINKMVEDAKADPTIVPAPPPGVNFNTTHVVGVRRG